MLAHVPSLGRNPRGSPDFLAYPVPKACMHVLGTRVPRRLGVARSASSPKAAQALGCSLTPGLRISFGRVTCMARAASVPGLWALGFLLLCGVCVLVRFAVGCGFCQPHQSWLGSWVGVFGHGLWCCPSSVGCLWCSWLGFGFGLLMGRVWFRARPACPRRFRFRRAVWACVLGLGLGCAQLFVAGLSGCVFCAFFFFAGCPCPGPCGPCPPIPFLSGWAAGSFFFRGVCLHVSVSLFPVGRCSWLGVAGFGWVVPPCLFGGPVFGAFWGGFGRLWWCWRAVWWLWAVFAPPPLPPQFFLFLGGVAACSSLCLPWLAHTLARIQCCLPGCCWRLRSVWPRSGPMGQVCYVHGRLGAPSCRVRSWLCRLGGCARRLLVALG